jgi:hypothetical protein
MNPSNQSLSDCHQAPVVLCEGNAWDVPLESIKDGSTYGYGCTECHKWCGIYEPNQPSNQPEQCICGYDPAAGYRMDVFCPVHDYQPQPKQNDHTCPYCKLIYWNLNQHISYAHPDKQNTPKKESVLPLVTHTSNADDPISNSSRSTVVDAHGSSISDTQAEVGLRARIIEVLHLSRDLQGQLVLVDYEDVVSDWSFAIDELIALVEADRSAAVVEAEQHNQWYSCKEQMPPYDELVVCRFEYFNKKFEPSYAVLKHVQEDDVCWRTADDNSEFNEMSATVTHWRPLARLQPPTALTEQEQLEVSFCQTCMSMTHTHDGICTRCGELKGATAGEGESV